MSHYIKSAPIVVECSKARHTKSRPLFFHKAQLFHCQHNLDVGMIQFFFEDVT